MCGNVSLGVERIVLWWWRGRSRELRASGVRRRNMCVDFFLMFFWCAASCVEEI